MTKETKYKVWFCKLVIEVPDDGLPYDGLPSGFDSVPRDGAREAVEAAGFPVVGMFTGWGGELSEAELSVLEYRPSSNNRMAGQDV